MPCRCPLKYHHSSGALCGASSCGSRTPAAPLPAAGPALTRSGTIVPADAAPEPVPSDIATSAAQLSAHSPRRRANAFGAITVVSIAYASYARQYMVTVAIALPSADPCTARCTHAQNQIALACGVRDRPFGDAGCMAMLGARRREATAMNDAPGQRITRNLPHALIPAPIRASGVKRSSSWKPAARPYSGTLTAGSIATFDEPLTPSGERERLRRRWSGSVPGRSPEDARRRQPVPGRAAEAG